MTRLFVYGTLMTGQERNFYLSRDKAQCCGPARTAPQYSLFRPLLADYPCLVEDKKRGKAVEGELWEVSESCLLALDSVEGVPALFQRRVIALENGEQALAYMMPAKLWFAKRLEGRW